MSNISQATIMPALPGYPNENGWYCIVFLDEDSKPVYGPIYELTVCADGEHEWNDDTGEVVEHLFDPFLQVRVAMDAADGYIRQ